MILIDRACFERGCACYDSRIDEDPVEVIAKREWVGLTPAEVATIFTNIHTWYERAEAIETKLRSKNHD